MSSKANLMRMETPDNTNSFVQCGTWKTDSSMYDSVNARISQTEIRQDDTQYARTNYVSCPVPTEFDDSYRHSETRKHADGTSIVRWSEQPPTTNPREANRVLSTQTLDSLALDESVYYTAKRTDEHPKERPANANIREKQTLKFDSSVESDDEETPRRRSKKTKQKQKQMRLVTRLKMQDDQKVELGKVRILKQVQRNIRHEVRPNLDISIELLQVEARNEAYREIRHEAEGLGQLELTLMSGTPRIVRPIRVLPMTRALCPSRSTC